ncbi:MAG: hypothetical protein SF029_21760 [bacterium]|nr:hypothetical protein [bacterium]
MTNTTIHKRKHHALLSRLSPRTLALLAQIVGGTVVLTSVYNAVYANDDVFAALSVFTRFLMGAFTGFIGGGALPFSLWIMSPPHQRYPRWRSLTLTVGWTLTFALVYSGMMPLFFSGLLALSLMTILTIGLMRTCGEDVALLSSWLGNAVIFGVLSGSCFTTALPWGSPDPLVVFFFALIAACISGTIFVSMLQDERDEAEKVYQAQNVPIEKGTIGPDGELYTDEELAGMEWPENATGLTSFASQS